MPLFTKNNFDIFYVHIPRTSGRYVKELFVHNQFESRYHEFSMDSVISNIVPTHLHYPLYNYHLGVSNIPHFTIVRNPIDRIWSALDILYKIHKQENFFKNLENKQWFYDRINYERSVLSFHNNWFMPQYDFISYKTHIYRYEKGMGKNFISWYNNIFSETIKEYNPDYYKMESELKYSEKYKITKK